MRVLLVNAPHTDDGEQVRRFSRPWVPLDLLNCAALLRQDGHEVSLVDYRAIHVTPETRDAAVASADLILVTTTPLDRWQCPTLNTDALFRFLRQFPRETTWVSGAHGTMRPDWVLEATGVAGLVLGEPEASVRELAAAGPAAAAGPGFAVRRDGRLLVERADPVDLTTLPVPAFDLVDIAHYQYELMGDRFLILEMARGCPFGCTFCSREMYGRRVRRKTIAQVANEIDRALADTGFRHAYFIDLEFTFHREPVVELCETILSRGWQFEWTCQTRFDQVDEPLLHLMKRAGCRLIHFGVETGTERHAEALRKGLAITQILEQHALVRRMGIETALFFLIGHPDETADEQVATIELACALNPDYASFNIASPYPGTRFHEQAGPFDEAFPPVADRWHDLAALDEMRRTALRRFYLRPRYVFGQVQRWRMGSAMRGLRLFRQLVR